MVVRKYGCWNTPRAAGYMVRDGSVPVTDMGLTLEAQKLRPHVDRMTVACQYDQRWVDARCEGCGK